jgi:hypothetical protein
MHWIDAGLVPPLRSMRAASSKKESRIRRPEPMFSLHIIAALETKFSQGWESAL